jgi:hypothetical protein
MAIPAVFAVFAGNNQPPGSRSPRKSWAGAGIGTKEQRNTPLFSRCFPLFLWKEQ